MTTTLQNQKPANNWTFFGQLYGWKAFLVVIGATLIAGFSDPDYGFNLYSVRLLLSMFLVLFFLNYGGLIVKKIFGSRKKKGYLLRMSARPVFLLFLVFSIIFARWSGIQPALIFGSVLGIEFLANSDEQRIKYAGRASIAGMFWAVITGLSAWLLYSVVAAVPTDMLTANQDPNSPQVLLAYLLTGVGEYLAMLTIAALAALPITLLPFKFLEGGHIYRYNKIAWVVTYLIAISSYTFALVSLPASWQDVSGSFIWWVSTYVVYVIVALGIWSYFRFKRITE